MEAILEDSISVNFIEFGLCIECDRVFERTVLAIDEKRFMPQRCGACFSRIMMEEEKRQKQQHVAALMEQWPLICPPSYRNTDANRLPQSQYKEVMDWKLSDPMGLVLVGKSGTMKTRTAMQKLKYEYLDDKRVMYISGNLFRQRLAKAIEANSVESWMNSLQHQNLILIDDIDKIDLGKIYDTSVESNVFQLVETITAYSIPVIITTQLTGAAYSAKFKDEATGEAVYRRIKEYCKPVKF